MRPLAARTRTPPLIHPHAAGIGDELDAVCLDIADAVDMRRERAGCDEHATYARWCVTRCEAGPRQPADDSPEVGVTVRIDRQREVWRADPHLVSAELAGEQRFERDRCLDRARREHVAERDIG